MQRITLLVATLILALCLTNGYAAEENQSESESCWVIVKETYEWITDNEEMAAMHYVVSNLTYDSECRLIERTDESNEDKNHDFISYNVDGTISNTSEYMYYAGEIVYLWEEAYGYNNGVLVNRNWVELSYYDGNYSVNVEWNTVYTYDSQGREILANSTTGDSSNEVATSYDENGNVMQVDTSVNGELSNIVEYTYSSDNHITTQTTTNYYGSTVVEITTNYSYDEEGKLISKEQYDEPNNWTMYWNMTYDDNGNKITEEFHRVGNSPWSTLRTYTWSYVGEQTNQDVDSEISEPEDGEEQTNEDVDSEISDSDDDGDQPNQDAEVKDSDSEDDTSSNIWIIIVIILLAIGTTYLVYYNTKQGVTREFKGFDTDKLIEDVLEEE